MLITEGVSQLVGHNLRITDDGIDIRVRVTVDPGVDTTVCNEFTQFRRKCGIDQGVLMLLRNDKPRRQMMRHYNYLVGSAFLHALPDESQTILVHCIIILDSQPMSVI